MEDFPLLHDYQINIWIKNKNMLMENHIVAPLCSGYHYSTASTKPELRPSAGSNSSRGVSEIPDGEDLWQWSRLEIRLSAFVGEPYRKKNSSSSSSSSSSLSSSSSSSPFNYIYQIMWLNDYICQIFCKKGYLMLTSLKCVFCRPDHNAKGGWRDCVAFWLTNVHLPYLGDSFKQRV